MIANLRLSHKKEHDSVDAFMTRGDNSGMIPFPDPYLVGAFKRHETLPFTVILDDSFLMTDPMEILPRIDRVLAGALAGFLTEKQVPLPTQPDLPNLWGIVKTCLHPIPALDNSSDQSEYKSVIADIVAAYELISRTVDQHVRRGRSRRFYRETIKSYACAAEALVSVLFDLAFFIPF